MTGLPIILRGCSFSNDSQIARCTIFMSQIALLFLSAIVFDTDPQKVLPASISRCTRIGPRLRAGKNVNAPTITITPTRSTLNKGVVTGNVPSEGGTYFFLARFPAIASMGRIMKNLPTSMVIAPDVLYQNVFPFKPPKADPLLPAIEVKA